MPCTEPGRTAVLHLTGGTKGKELRPSKMAVSPSMDHMNLVPGDSAASSRVMSSTELAAAAAPAEAAPLLGHVGDAASRRILPR